MLRYLTCLGALTALAAVPLRALPAAEKTTWEEAELRKLEGRWTTVREEKTGKDTVRRRRVELVFTAGKLKVYQFDEKGVKKGEDEINVIGAEEMKGVGLGSIARLNLRGNATQKVGVYYDIVGGRLTLVGRIGFRPWEGFPLSGEYRRPEKPR